MSFMLILFVHTHPPLFLDILAYSINPLSNVVIRKIRHIAVFKEAFAISNIQAKKSPLLFAEGFLI